MKRPLSEREDPSVLKWVGHMGQMNERRLAKRGMNTDVGRLRRGGRLKFTWVDAVRKTLRGRGMTVEQGKQNALNRRGWEIIVSMSVVWVAVCA